MLKAANIEAQEVYNSNDKEDIKIRGEILESLEVSSKYICFN